MPNYGGESSGPSDLGGGNYSGVNAPGNYSGSGGGVYTLPYANYGLISDSMYIDPYGIVTPRHNYMPTTGGEPSLPSPSPATLGARSDMANRGMWGQGYMTPQMNPMSMYGPAAPFSWGDFFGMFGGK